MKTQEVPVFYGGNHNVNPGGILLDCRLLHNCSSDSNSVSWRLLGSFLATQWYKVRPYAIKADEVVVLCGGSTLAEFYSKADSSQPLLGFRFCFLEVVGLVASYPAV